MCGGPPFLIIWFSSAASASASAGVAGLSTSEIESAFEDVTLYEAPDDDIEAQTIALALREGLDRPAYVSALVTPDRGLAERVKGHLQLCSTRTYGPLLYSPPPIS